MKKAAFLLLIFWGCIASLRGADTLLIKAFWADWDSMLNTPDDAIRLKKTVDVATRMSQLLSQGMKPGRIMKPQMKYSHLATKDSTIQVLTWSVPLLSGSYTYGGIILKQSGHLLKIYLLKDFKEAIATQAELKQTSPEQWFGAVYYQMLEFRHKKKNYYFLLGWDGGRYPVARKLIEVLTFDAEGKPLLGAQVFSGSKIYRKIFEYQQDVYFLLKYDKQTLYRKVWSSRKPLPRKEYLIVFNRLGREPGFAAPIPVINIVDAYRWNDGKLILIKDVDARNPEGKFDKEPPPTPATGLFPKE